MKNKTSKELPTLTEYHWQRNRDTQKAVDEMLKNPYTFQQAKEQVERLNKQKENRNKNNN